MNYLSRSKWVAAICLLTAGMQAEASEYYPEENDSFMGQYQGERILEDGSVEVVFGQVFPVGNNHYEARLRSTMETGVPEHVVLNGWGNDTAIDFPPAIGHGADQVIQVTQLGLLIAASQWNAELKSDTLNGWFAGHEKGRFELEKVVDKSSTLEMEPPAGAVVLFNGKDLNNWKHAKSSNAEWKLVDGAMQVVPRTGNLVSKQTFGDHRLHLEFRTPLMPEARGQGRGNSGVYLHGRYEVQVLDSFGLDGTWSECGGIYKISRPRVNMAAPPTQWQTYDIDFRAPRFDENGNKTENARITVRHNGVVIQDDVELPDHTGGPLENNEVPKGPLMLQDHSNPVQFRNVWVVEK